MASFGEHDHRHTVFLQFALDPGTNGRQIGTAESITNPTFTFGPVATNRFRVRKSIITCQTVPSSDTPRLTRTPATFERRLSLVQSNISQSRPWATAVTSCSPRDICTAIFWLWTWSWNRLLRSCNTSTSTAHRKIRLAVPATRRRHNIIYFVHTEWRRKSYFFYRNTLRLVRTTSPLAHLRSPPP